jgi:type IV secretion system protein VirB6
MNVSTALDAISRVDITWLTRGMKILDVSPADFLFFRTILDYLDAEINNFGFELMSRVMGWVGLIALSALTLWIMIQGYRIATGQSRDSLMVLVVNATRAAFIVTLATTMGVFGQGMHTFLTNDVANEITHMVTGDNKSAADQIDENLGYMQLALGMVDMLDVQGDEILDKSKDRALYAIGLGTGGPAVTAGAMLLLYKVALALFIGLGPLFILFLLFEQTKQFFSKWLFYGIGTMFSMAVLAAMTSIAMKMVAKVSAAFWIEKLLGSAFKIGSFSEGMSSMAMQQGGMGLILTTLILTAPPMAAMFFQGTLGSFMAYSQIGGSPGHSRPGPQGQPPGSWERHGADSTSSRGASGDVGTTNHLSANRTPGSMVTSAEQVSGARGAANKQ